VSGKRQTPLRVDRRTTIKWLAATMAAQAACVTDRHWVGPEIPPAPTGDESLLGTAAASGGVGYGADPDLMHPSVPWPKTMSDGQLRTASALADMILPADEHSPAASAVGVPDFIDEWVSAPYPDQRRDRETIFAGLEWLEREGRRRFGASFTAARESQKAELLDGLAWPVASDTDLADGVEFFRRFRYLAVGAFYSTPDGMRDAGYVGNVAIAGPYPGPSDEAMAHLEGVLQKLGLDRPD
jgi:Gluconate 2-dehydrogenase subunit 3